MLFKALENESRLSDIHIPGQRRVRNSYVQWEGGRCIQCFTQKSVEEETDCKIRDKREVKNEMSSKRKKKT